MSAATRNGVFRFTSGQTIDDLLLVAETLRRSGQRPTLRFVRSYNEEIESVAVDVAAEESARPTEMAVAGAEDDAPDPAVSLDRLDALVARCRQIARNGILQQAMDIGKVVEAIRTINRLQSLGDAIYDVRARAAESMGDSGNSWEHPDVGAYSDAVSVLTKEGVL